VLTPRTSRITARRSGKIRFTLSKISRVTLKITKNGKPVTTLSPGVLSRGTKSVAWTAPKKSGDYDVTISATDLANNAATATGVITVKRRG
jgi:hypothetical protein